MSQLFPERSRLPEWLAVPHGFERILEQKLLDLNPWGVLVGQELLDRFEGMKSRYASKDYVPFAKRFDCDDVACWAKGEGGRVVIVHDFASDGSERRGEHEDFWTWFRVAIEDMIEFD